MMAASPLQRSTLRLWLLSLGAIIVTGAALWYMISKSGGSDDPDEVLAIVPAPPDPRLAYQGPFRNVHPSVKYVGNAVCAKCHSGIAKRYAQHPMGKSLLPIAKVAVDPVKNRDIEKSFEADGSQFLVEKAGKTVRHVVQRLDEAGRPIFPLTLDVDYAMGSGVRGHSFLTMRKGGYLFQTPISWYARKQIWDKSPGFTPEHFAGRPVEGMCLSCHANGVEAVPGYLNRFKTPITAKHFGIGCERCHGPGELHVRVREKEKLSATVDHTIVNPKHLSAGLREAVCQQCHLEGEVRVLKRGRSLNDFRPGLPLQDFWAIFVHTADAGVDRKTVNHVEQMVSSRCFQKSRGGKKLGCVSCHDSHEQASGPEKVGFYRDRCLQCHQSNGCRLNLAKRLRHNKADSCVACHMPRYGTSDVAHSAATDHRILRDPVKTGADQQIPNRNENANESVLPIVDFFRGKFDAQDREAARDMGLALAQLALEGSGKPLRNTGQALLFLQSAVDSDPGDLAALEAYGEVLRVLKKKSSALASFEKLLSKISHHERALVAAASLAQEMGQLQPAIKYWRRATLTNPWVPSYRGNLARLLAFAEDWPAAAQECRRWLKLDPGNIDGRRLWMRCLENTGQGKKATTEQNKLTIPH